MDSSQLEDSPVAGRNHLQDSGASERRDARSCEAEILREITEQLQRDRDECWQALEGLASVEPELRLAIIDALSGGSPGQGGADVASSTGNGTRSGDATGGAGRSAMRRSSSRGAPGARSIAIPLGGKQTRAGSTTNPPLGRRPTCRSGVAIVRAGIADLRLPGDAGRRARARLDRDFHHSQLAAPNRRVFL